MKKFLGHLFTSLLVLLCANVFAQDTTSTSPKKDSLTLDSVFTIIEEMPQFPGGEQALFKFLWQNMRYPPEAREQGIQGRVYVRFWVEEDGTLNYIDIIKSPHKSLAEEALRIMHLMPKWKPGKQNGKPVRMQYNLPVTFTLK